MLEGGWGMGRYGERGDKAVAVCVFESLLLFLVSDNLAKFAGHSFSLLAKSDRKNDRKSKNKRE